MKLKNSALQELYDKIANGTLTFSVYEESSIDMAFRECDEKLSDSATFAYIQSLEKRNDILKRSELNLLETNMEQASKKRQLEKDLDDAKNQLNYFTHSRDDWQSRAKHAEDEVEDLKKELQNAKTTLVKANADRTNLQEACDKLSGENRRLNARIECLREEVNWYRKHYKEQSDKIRELKSRLNSMCGDAYIRSFRDSDPEIRQKECFTTMIDGFETVGCPYLRKPEVIEIQFNPDCFSKEN